MNSNVKVHGLADFKGARSEIVVPLIERGVGVIQLPCPEATFLGMCRWGMTREQYDTPAYRRHCSVLVAPVVDTLLALVKDGCEIESIVGVDGSPSCGVNRTCFGYAGGEIERLAASGDIPVAVSADMSGVFMEELKAQLLDAGLDLRFIGREESADGARIE